jgi:hypothetical protein
MDYQREDCGPTCSLALEDVVRRVLGGPDAQKITETASPKICDGRLDVWWEDE